MSSKILVIGATGFVGNAVIEKLVSRRPGLILAASRTTETSDTEEIECVKSVYCDVFDIKSLHEAIRGVDVVINCFRERTTEQDAAVAIQNILNACEHNKVKRLIYFSSVAVYGEARGVVTEETLPCGPINWYGRAKLAAERACAERASEDFRIVALRPSLVYGPKGMEWSLAFLRSIARGHLLGLGAAGAGTANLVYVEDLADFCERLISAAIPAFSIFNLNGFPAPTFNDYFGEIAQGLGKKAREGGGGAVRNHGQMRRVARGALRGLRRLLGPLLARNPRLASAFATACAAMGARPEDRAATAYSRPVFYSPDRAIAMGFVPRTPLDVGVRNSIAWARSQNLV